MAKIDKLYKSMGLPMNIKRGNPWPLDASSVWYSYDEMKAYAEDAKGVAYVGQILALVDENNIAEAYIISDDKGTLKPVGSGVVVDNKTIMIEEEAIGLKDFGKRFYKYVPEVKNDEGTVTKEAGYELVEVSETNPWVAGLEPRVVSEDGQFVLGWFEPNPTTIEGVNNQVSALQTTVADLAKELGDPAEGEKAATGIYAELDKKANAADVYTKDEVDAAIAAVDHLQRKIVTSYNDILAFINEHGAEEAARYIFMVPESDTTADGNLYEEYIVVDGVIEVIGKWATDLSDYVTESELAEELKNYLTPGGLETVLGDYVTDDKLAEELQNYTDLQTLSDLLDGVAKKEDLSNYATKTDLTSKVDVVEGSRLITEEEAQKLINLPDNAEENFIKSVDTINFLVDTEGKLSLNTQDAASEIAKLNAAIQGHTDSLDSLIQKVTANETSIKGLQDSLKTTNENLESLSLKYDTAQEAINQINETMTSTKRIVDENKQAIQDLNDSLSNYVLKDTYDTDIAELRDILT